VANRRFLSFVVGQQQLDHGGVTGAALQSEHIASAQGASRTHAGISAGFIPLAPVWKFGRRLVPSPGQLIVRKRLHLPLLDWQSS
jgi:hypothetical protein